MDEEFNQYERLYIGKTIAYKYGVQEHLDRYKFSQKYVKSNFTVLDAACGSGYGIEIISNSIKKVIGLEISDHALNFARNRYQKNNIEFKKGDLNNPIDLPDNYFDAIVSFETVEHVSNQKSMISEFKRILKPRGTLIISSPDREVINEDGVTHNKFHVSELSKKEFIDLISNYFELEEIFGQTKHIILPWYKRFIKKIAKLDVWGIRRVILKWLHLNYFVHKHFAPMAEIPIEKTSINSPDRYFTLILVCKNNK